MAYIPTVQTVFVNSAYGIQAAWGTAATALNKSLGFDLKFSQKGGKGEYAPATSMTATAQTQGETYSEGSIDGRLSSEEGQDFIVTLPARVALTPRFFTFELNGTQYMDCFVTGWTVDAKNTEVTMSATVAGKFGTAVTETTPTCDQIYLFTGGFTLLVDGAAFEDVMSVKIEAQNLFKTGFFGGILPVKPVQKQPSITIAALVSATAEHKAKALAAGTHTIVFSTSQTSGAIVHTYSFSGSVFFNDPSEESDNDGVYGFTMNGKFVALTCEEETNIITVAFLPAKTGG